MGYPVRDSPVGIARKVQPGWESPEGTARMGPNIARRGVAERARRRGDCTWQGVSDSEWQTESNEADWPRDGDDLTAPPGACNSIDLFLPDDLKKRRANSMYAISFLANFTLITQTASMYCILSSFIGMVNDGTFSLKIPVIGMTGNAVKILSFQGKCLKFSKIFPDHAKSPEK